MHQRVRQARRIQGAAVGGATAISAIWYGPGMLLLVVAAAAVLGLLEKPRNRIPPEVASAASILAFELLIVVGVAGTGGAVSPMLPTAVIPTIMLCARFRQRVVIMGLTLSVVMTGTALWLANLVPDPPTAPPAVHILWFAVMLTSVVAAATILLASDITSREEAQLDPLTGLLNRKALSDQMALLTSRAVADAGRVAVLVCDIDHFKHVNDTLGHAVGDQVLVEVANRVMSCLRIKDKIFRWGGEEFVVVLSGDASDSAEVVAARILETVRETPIVGRHVTLSVGVAMSIGSADAASLIPLADRAMYAAKNAGRNQVWRATGTDTDAVLESCQPTQNHGPQHIELHPSG